MTPNFYWNVYKSLKKELIALSEVIHIDDNQLSVYSMKIADLLLEIENIRKTMPCTYKANALMGI